MKLYQLCLKNARDDDTSYLGPDGLYHDGRPWILAPTRKAVEKFCSEFLPGLVTVILGAGTNKRDGSARLFHDDPGEIASCVLALDHCGMIVMLDYAIAAYVAKHEEPGEQVEIGVARYWRSLAETIAAENDETATEDA